MAVVSFTKEEIQKRIDHYRVVAEAYKRKNDELGRRLSEERKKNSDSIDWQKWLDEEHKNHMYYSFYCGKADAYCDLYNELFPEMEGKRAFLLNEESFEIDVKAQMMVI